MRKGGQLLYRVRVYLNGRERERLCRTPAEREQAQAELRAELEREASGDTSFTGSEDIATFARLLREYETDLLRRSRSRDSVERASQVRRVLERDFPDLAALPVSVVDVHHFENFRDGRHVKPATVNRDLRVLRAALKRARPTFVVPNEIFLPEAHHRVRWLTARDTAIFRGIPEPVRTMSRLAAETLMRQGEVRKLRRSAVQLHLRVIELDKAKGGPGQVVLNSCATTLLKQQLRRLDRDIARGDIPEDCPWVFPNPQGRPYSRVHVSRAFRLAARAKGLTDFTFHDLRHHGATTALNHGASLPQLMQLGRWKNAAMVQRYAAATDRALRRIAEKISRPLSERRHQRPS
ncbi:MAG: tyrosine-type recombinase/integrase [Candidatus Rokubacteria bacterium]|nr:tyrosine-type recombinase/integrase [Candidatus Rokubacteria bacterium]